MRARVSKDAPPPKPSSIGAAPRGVTPTSFIAPKPIVSTGSQQRSRAREWLSSIKGSPESIPTMAMAGLVPALGADTPLDEDIADDPEVNARGVYLGSAHRQNQKMHISHDHLRAVSQSPDGKRLVAGGQEVLSIINTSNLTPQGGEMDVEFNILQRTLMSSSKGSRASKVWDVRWHPNDLATIASTSDDGLVSLWRLDSQEMKKPVWEGRDNTRSCWRLAWCDPENGGNNLLCSGSLDGIVRLWDFRASNKSQKNYTLGGNHDGSHSLVQGASGLKVRDLRVCGAEPYKLAAGMESNNEGDIVVWDLRQDKKPVFRKAINSQKSSI
jgi:WD40 repeat protein